jgi:hypothetical protein
MVFLSPPIDRVITKLSHVDLGKMCALDTFRMFEAAKKISENVIFYLPPNTKIEQVSDI